MVFTWGLHFISCFHLKYSIFNKIIIFVPYDGNECLSQKEQWTSVCLPFTPEIFLVVSSTSCDLAPDCSIYKFTLIRMQPMATCKLMIHKVKKGFKVAKAVFEIGCLISEFQVQPFSHSCSLCVLFRIGGNV